MTAFFIPKMAVQGTPQFYPSIKATNEPAKTVRINFAELWNLVEKRTTTRGKLNEEAAALQ